MPRSNIFRCRIEMPQLVIKENIRTEALQERAFFHTAQKQRFINPNAPASQRANDTLVSRGASRGDQRRAYG